MIGQVLRHETWHEPLLADHPGIARRPGGALVRNPVDSLVAGLVAPFGRATLRHPRHAGLCALGILRVVVLIRCLCAGCVRPGRTDRRFGRCRGHRDCGDGIDPPRTLGQAGLDFRLSALGGKQGFAQARLAQTFRCVPRSGNGFLPPP